MNSADEHGKGAVGRGHDHSQQGGEGDEPRGAPGKNIKEGRGS